jgi:hypothetical protein
MMTPLLHIVEIALCLLASSLAAHRPPMPRVGRTKTPTISRTRTKLEKAIL